MRSRFKACFWSVLALLTSVQASSCDGGSGSGVAGVDAASGTGGASDASTEANAGGTAGSSIAGSGGAGAIGGHAGTSAGAGGMTAGAAGLGGFHDAGSGGTAGAAGTTGNAGAAGGGACAGADLATDPRNCGACGHDCLGGSCAARKCQPVKIAPISSAFVVDATHVYAHDSGSILKLDKLENAFPTSLTTSNVTPYYFADDYPNVYFSAIGAPGQIFRVSKTGGGPSKVVAETQQGQEVTVDQIYLYYVRSMSDQVMRVDKSATNASPEVFAAAQPGRFVAAPLAVPGGSWPGDVYWLSGDRTTLKTTAILRSGAAGLAPPSIVAGGTAIRSFRVDSGQLYYLDEGVGVFKLPATGGTASPLATAPGVGADGLTGYALAVGGGFVYWASRVKRELYRVPVAGGAIETVAAGYDFNWVNQERMAADADRVYFCDASGLYMLAH